ncbi:MAG TPA: HYR domain-containing protein, partial [Saprospiraceae bacterium]|nr:HYR domain-containing protein [Saprospiraceae bacterium]
TVVTFTARDSCGNMAQCTTRVTVIETVPPEIDCPDDLTVDCDVNTDSLAQFGLPDVRDNCPGVTYTETVTRNQNICGIGTITRKFVAIDASGNRDSCTQTITIENADPLEDADMIWPLSPIGVGECESTDPMVTGSPAFDSTGISCLRASISYADTNLCSGNFCEIQRTWTVFDTCSNVTLNFVQHIIRNDPNAPNILGVRDTTLYASDTACNNYVPLVAYVDNCDSAMITITNNSPCCGNGMEDASGFYPVGTTSVTFIAEDGCCNVSRLTVRIIVIDTITPEVTCRKVVKKIRDDGCARFNSQEFIVRIGDNCTDSARIMTSFNRNNFMDTIRVFCCDSIRNYEYTAAVTVYFKDEAGNIDSCQTLLQAVDEDTICGPTFTSVIKGLVKSRKLTRMPGVEVMLNDGLMGMAATRSDGSYGFYDMANGGSYGLKAQHDLNPTNGVSTADIIHIQRHILGTVPFTDPLKFVAADVNNNRRITAADIVEIRKLVLGKTDRFAAVPSWKFLLSDYTFRDLEDPLSEDYKMEYTINKLNRNFYVDFTGVKMGDVDDSNDPVHFGGSITRSNNAILLVGQDQKLLKDQVYALELSLSQFRELDGMQFGVEVDPNLAILEGWEAVDESGLTEDMVYLVPERNSFRVSYLSARADLDTWTIRLKVRMKQAASWSEIIRMESDAMLPEAYFKDGTIASVRLDFTDQYSSDAGLSLYQNIPNPFRHTTVIPFYTDQDAEIGLRIVDLNGRVVLEQRSVFAKGYHELEIPRSRLNRSGMYYYQLKTKDSSLFRRMILTD